MVRYPASKRFRGHDLVSSTPVCEERVVSRWSSLPGEVLASVVELAQDEFNDEQAGDEDGCEWDGLLAFKLVCSEWNKNLASAFITAFEIDHTQLNTFLKSLTQYPNLGEVLNSLSLVIDSPVADLGSRSSTQFLPRLVKRTLAQLSQLVTLKVDLSGNGWSTRPVSHLLHATPVAPLALPATLTKLQVAQTHLWLDELQHVFECCPGLIDLEVSSLRGNCTKMLGLSRKEHRVQLERVVVHQTTLVVAQLIWLLGHCSPTALATLEIQLPSFVLPGALTGRLLDLAGPLKQLHLRDRFAPPKAPVAPAAPVPDDATDPNATPPPPNFWSTLLSRAPNLTSFTLCLSMCPCTPTAADGVVQLLAHLQPSVTTLLLDERSGSAALRAGIVAHLEAVEEKVGAAEGPGLREVVTVAGGRKAEGPGSRAGRQFEERLGEFGVGWRVKGEEGAVQRG